jgi:hypothetical protein
MANARLAVVVRQHVILDRDHRADPPRAPGGPVLHQMGVMDARLARRDLLRRMK